MTKNEMITVVQQEFKGLSTQFEETDYYNAATDAERETGWSFPETNVTKLKWLKDRTKRHLIYMIMTVSAHKFKFKQYNLQNRFEHYNLMIKQMDDEWKEFLAGIDILLLEGVGAFSTKIDAGFSYNQYGEDTTYEPENVVSITPSDSDS